MGRIIGIDLGTTNSVAAYWRGKKPRVIDNEYASFTPSVVWLEKGIERIGRDAKDRLELGSSNIIYSIKRFMGVDFDDSNAQTAMSRIPYSIRQAANGEVEVLLDGAYYTPVQISAMILRQIKRDAEVKLGEEVTHAVITVPAYFGQRQKSATREAGQLAGLVVSRIINEPTAAALAFGVEEEIDEPQDVLVYDLGGGTFDVSILSIIDNNFDVLNIDGDRFLGGDDFDNLIVGELLNHLKREHRVEFGDDSAGRSAKLRLKALAEKAKIDLSRQDETHIIGEALTQVGGKPVNLNLNFTRAQFESLIKPQVDRSIEIVYGALEEASLKPDELDRVLLVGGSTRIPLIRQRLKTIFGDKIQIDVDPMQCVALGAAVQTAFLSEEELAARPIEEMAITPRYIQSPVIIEKADDLPQITMQDMLSKFIGIETEQGDFIPVVPKGTLYPTQDLFRQIFHLNRQGQQVYELPVYESEREDNPREKWEWIGVVRNDKLPPGLPKASDVMVEMSIDKDGILYVTSYLKNDPLKDDADKGTLVQKSIIFGGNRKSATDLFGDLNLVTVMFRVIAENSNLNKYLSPQQVDRARYLSIQGEPILQTRDEIRAQQLLDQMTVLRKELPAPVEDLFFAHLILDDKNVVTPVERGNVQQLMTQMETAATRGDIDTANMHLRDLRQRTTELYLKYPSALLRK